MVCYNQGMMEVKSNCLALALRQRNAKAEAWVAEDPDNRWAMTLTEDLAHWAGYGVTDAESLEHYLLASEVYDAHKDAYGFKPSWARVDALSNDELREYSDRLCAVIAEQHEDALLAREQEKARKAKLLAPAPAFTLGDSFPL